MPRWGWALIAACAVVMIGLVALGIWAVGGGATNTDNWITYTAPDGSFTAKFPGEPAVQSHRLDNGVMVRETMYRSAWGHWEVSWIDMTGREIWFPAAVNELARTSGSKITLQEERKWKGKTGYYAELDEGLYTIQMFIARSRLWTIAVYKHYDTFQFFLDNLKISDEAMGIDPLSIDFAQEGVAFEGVDSTKWKITIRGGRMPYKVDLSKPTPDTRYVKDHTGEAWEDHIGSSSSAKAGSYPVQASVTDADGRTATGKWVVEVQKGISELGRLDVALRSGLIDVGSTGTNSIRVPVGCMMYGESVFVPTHPQYPIVQPYYNVDGLPEWLVLAPLGTGTFSGRAETVGVYTFRVHTKVVLQGLSKSFPMEREVTVEVVPLSKDDLPDQVGSFEVKHVTGFVGANLEGEVYFLAPVPDEWVGMRDWKVDAQWALTSNDMNKLLPKGMSADIQKPTRRDCYTRLRLFGSVQTAVETVVEFKLIVTIKYLPEPIELTASVQFKVESAVDAVQISEPMEALVRRRAGSDINKTVVAIIMVPPEWPSHVNFKYTVEWLLDEVKLPDGIRLDATPAGSSHGKDLRVTGSVNTPGEYFVEVPIRVTLSGSDKTHDLVQKIKIVIS